MSVTSFSPACASLTSVQRIRVAVVGAGAWGLNHIRVLAGEPSCELVAIADPDALAADRARQLAAVEWVRDPEQVFADAAIDAVVIASPSPTHARLARSALAANKHVLVEKPLALDLEDARAAARAARGCNRVAMVGHLMVYHPAVVRLRQLLH